MMRIALLASATIIHMVNGQGLLAQCGIMVPPCTAAVQGGYWGNDGTYYPPQVVQATTTTAAPASTSKAPPNRFTDAGWETDDNGNVFVGDDNSKLYLISVGSYWPFPKDYRKKRSTDNQLPQFFDKLKF